MKYEQDLNQIRQLIDNNKELQEKIVNERKELDNFKTPDNFLRNETNYSEQTNNQSINQPRFGGLKKNEPQKKGRYTISPSGVFFDMPMVSDDIIDFEMSPIDYYDYTNSGFGVMKTRNTILGSF